MRLDLRVGVGVTLRVVRFRVDWKEREESWLLESEVSTKVDMVNNTLECRDGLSYLALFIQ